MAKKSTNGSEGDRRTGDKIAISGDYQYNAFYKGSGLQRFWHRFKIYTAITSLDIQPGQHILDAGCGSGMLSALIGKTYPSVQVTGLDGNADAITFCQRQWKDLPNIHFIKGPIDELEQFANASLNGIAFLEVIEHLTEQQAIHILGEFYRILHQKGTLVISTPNRKSLWPLLETIMDLLRLAPRLKDDQHEKLYSGRELAEIARLNGFIAVKEQRINFIAPWVAALSEKKAAKLHEWEIRQNWLPGSLLVYTFIKEGSING
jgi:ubiquinone/menaquinone biosynthesis C-methylase UbiE